MNASIIYKPTSYIPELAKQVLEAFKVAVLVCQAQA